MRYQENELKDIWKTEEEMAHIKGWDFSHIHGRYEEENDLPWNYKDVLRQYLREDADILDYDTGGGEFLLSLNHPFHRTAAPIKRRGKASAFPLRGWVSRDIR